MDTVVFFIGQQKLVAAHIPGHMTSLGHNLLVVRGGDKAFFRLFEIAFVLKRQRFAQSVLQFDGELGRHLALGIEVFRRISSNDIPTPCGEYRSGNYKKYSHKRNNFMQNFHFDSPFLNKYQ